MELYKWEGKRREEKRGKKDDGEKGGRKNRREGILSCHVFFQGSERSRGLFKCTTAEMVQKLVKKGAKVDERRGDGTTPLMVHAEQGSKEVVRELIRQSVNVDLQDEVGICEL